MRRFIVDYDIAVAGIVEIEANTEDEALDKVAAMDPNELLKYADNGTASILDGSLKITDEVPEDAE